ncbi:MAG: slipin family protein [Deltaproteobacteria bacterium]|nr:MAG: slipin family protein [Deltaproteobacteria bacterium]
MSEASHDVPPPPSSKYGLSVVSLIVLGLVSGGVAAVALAARLEPPLLPVVTGGGLALGIYLALAPRIASQWERAVVLRLGKFVGLRGPGLFWIVPLLDRIVVWVDVRVRTTGFAAERTLTRDTVPVNVDAVLFWQVADAERAALGLENYEEAVAWAAQTALREVIGKTDLADMLAGRDVLDASMQKLIDERARAWGITVTSVEIRDVVIPQALEDAMSRRAQAEREKQARVILGDAEAEIAHSFSAAAGIYREDAIALQLRSLNLLYEGMKERGTLMIIPTTMADSMGASSYAGLAALAAQQVPHALDAKK